jgi:hypothetical protein
MESQVDLAYRIALLRAEIRRRMSTSGKWQSLPGLLDEMDDLRRQMLAPVGDTAERELLGA